MTSRLAIGSGLARSKKNRSRGPRAERTPFRVDYYWVEKQQRREAHTVENGVDQADAEARFQRRTPWVTVFQPTTAP